jgi:hypothetical protein
MTNIVCLGSVWERQVWSHTTTTIHTMTKTRLKKHLLTVTQGVWEAGIGIGRKRKSIKQ